MTQTSAAKPPTISTTQNADRQEWVLYLQQLLNYFYKTQVVTEDGEYGPTTDNAVAHFRELHQYGGEVVVDAEIWKLLGHEGKQLENVDKHAALVDCTDQGQSWAAAFAIVLNAKSGDSHDVAWVRSQVDAPESVAAHQAREYGGTLGLTTVNCDLDDPPSWSSVLKTHGPAWFPSPVDDTRVVVVAGIHKQDEKIEVHVLDPAAHADSWVDFTEFSSASGITEAAEYELLVAG